MNIQRWLYRLILLAALLWTISASADAMTGRVYEDQNENGRLDAGEPLVAGVGVTDGSEVVLSDAEGRYRLVNAGGEARLVYLSVPAGYQLGRGFYRLLEAEETGEALDLPLYPRTEPVGAAYTFVQVTDIHIGRPGDVELFQQAIRELHQSSPPPQFIIATGDLVNTGDKTEEYDGYLAGIRTSTLPWLSVFGNHDANKGTDRTANYHRYLGPDYYSFDVGEHHFVVLNSIHRSEKQTLWLERDLQLLGQDKVRVFFQHYPPGREELEELTGYGARAVLTGHWHSNKIVGYDGLLSLNSPPFFMGGIDNSGAGFRVVTLEGSRIASDWRYGGQEQTIEIVSPAETLRHPEGKELLLLASLYDTTAEVASARYRLSTAAGEPVSEGAFYAEGDVSWRGRESRALPPGEYAVEVAASDEKGRTWSKQSRFRVEKAGEPSVAEPGAQWPAFMGGPERTGRAPSSLQPPFELLWSTHVGGSIDFSSPVYAEGRVFIGVSDRDGLERNGVLALDVTTGAPLWFSAADSAIHHSIAYAEGRVFASAAGGRVYALEAGSGRLVWRHDLGDRVSRWIYAAPVVDEGVLYAGSSAFFAALEAAKGRELWTANPGRDWISSYSSPAVGKGRVLLGSMWLDGRSLFTLDRATGETAWRAAAVGLHGSAALDAGRAYFIDTQSKLHVVDIAAGTVEKTVELGEGWSACTPAVGERVVVVSDGAGKMVALERSTLEVRWERGIGRSLYQISPYRKDWKGITSSPTLSGQRVYIGGSDGCLYALDLEDGRIAWKHGFGAPVLSTPTVTGNLLLVGTSDGRVYALVGEVGSDTST